MSATSVLAGGIPPGSAVRAVKDGGAKLIAFSPALVLAKRLVRSGADALVIEGSEAGGHIGPVSLTVLAQEILPHLRDVPVFVAGGLGRGEAILSYLEMGAAGAQLGTRVRSLRRIDRASALQAGLRAGLRRGMRCHPYSWIPVSRSSRCADWRMPAPSGSWNTRPRTLRRFQSGELTKETAQLEIEHFWAGALRRAVIDGDIDEGSVMAGQSVGMVTAEQTIPNIIEELVEQAISALAARPTRVTGR